MRREAVDLKKTVAVILIMLAAVTSAQASVVSLYRVGESFTHRGEQRDFVRFSGDGDPCAEEGLGEQWRLGRISGPFFVLLCVREGRITDVTAYRALSLVAGGAELPRYMQDAKADILAIPGIVVDKDTPVTFKAHDRSGNRYAVIEDEDGVWVRSGEMPHT